MPIKLGRKVVGIGLVLACYDLQSILDLLNRHSYIVLYAYSSKYTACKKIQWMYMLEAACRPPVLVGCFWWISRGAREKECTVVRVSCRVCVAEAMVSEIVLWKCLEFIRKSPIP